MMADTFLVHGARALAKADSGEDCYDTLDEGMQIKLQERARAVWEAGREPSHAMLEAGAVIVRNVHAEESEAAFESDAANTWRYMIDEALRQK